MTNPNYIEDPEYVDPDYKINYLKELKLTRESPNAEGYVKKYNNNLSSAINYNRDLNASKYTLKYLNRYKGPLVNSNYHKRQIDVNNYYIMKYQSESYILKLIIFFCGLSLVGSLFYLKGFIEETFYIIYLGIIISLGIMIISYSIYKLVYRDNKKFDESDYGYMPFPGSDISGNDEDEDISGNDISGNDTNDKEKCD